MKKKSLFYLIVGIFGIVLIVLAIVLDGRVSNAVDGTLMGAGAALMGVGISMWQFFRWDKKNPEKWKLYEIESHDERNVAIQLRAKAIAGEVLQWTVMVAAWIAIFLDAPLWVILAIVGAFISKTILEMCLMAKYQKEM
ncbi:MAG: hypothetical protein J1E83_14800 [Lachnospiraceae bacterium]|nr:hypothetical protein [Lachnospiraceae bacterium]